LNLTWVTPAEEVGFVPFRGTGLVAFVVFPTTKGPHVIAEIHCSPNPPGNEESQYAHIEAAIALAENSGLKYEVGALGTTVEGSPDEVWTLLRRMHESTLESGASSIITNIRFAQRAGSDAPRMDELVAPFRK
jgi:uncharacterized protein YqgV (UPF0045/DUF77 family)